jgi:GntR family transcriptional regulator
MYLAINQASELPVYQQIVDQIKREIALGRLSSTDKIPTVRELAAKLVINPNTIAKAYKILEQQGIVVTRVGAGTFVSEAGSSLSDDARKAFVCGKLEMAAVEAATLRIAKPVVSEWFEMILNQFLFRDSERN